MIKALAIAALAAGALTLGAGGAQAAPPKCALMKAPETVKVCNPDAESGSGHAVAPPPERTYADSGEFTLRDRNGDGFKEWGMDPKLSR